MKAKLVERQRKSCYCTSSFLAKDFAYLLAFTKRLSELRGACVTDLYTVCGMTEHPDEDKDSQGRGWRRVSRACRRGGPNFIPTRRMVCPDRYIRGAASCKRSAHAMDIVLHLQCANESCWVSHTERCGPQQNREEGRGIPHRRQACRSAFSLLTCFHTHRAHIDAKMAPPGPALAPIGRRDRKQSHPSSINSDTTQKEHLKFSPLAAEYLTIRLVVKLDVYPSSGRVR